MKELKINLEYKQLITDLTSDEYKELEESIVKEGCRDSICVWDGTIVDGHNRYKICVEHGIKFNVYDMLFDNNDEAKIWILKNQFGRRNLSAYDRSVLALKLENLLKSIAKDKQIQGGKVKVCQKSDKPPIDTKKELAKVAGVSHDTIHKVKKIEAKASPEVKEQLRRGETTINKVYNNLNTHVGKNTGENEWYTPVEFIKSAREVMGMIDCDPASSDIANETVGADKYFTVEIDGLKQKWEGKVWLNPPYAQPLVSQFSDAVIKKRKEYSEILILVNNATETEWLQNILKICSGICLVKGRIKFLDINGKPGAPLQGQIVIYIGDSTDKFSNVFSKHGEVFLK